MDYSTRSAFEVSAIDHIDTMKKYFACETNKNLRLQTITLFKVYVSSASLNKEESSIIWAQNEKCAFLLKRGCPDAKLGVGFASAHTSVSSKQDKGKVV